MVVDNFFPFVHAAVTDLDGVSVEDFSELMIFGKVLVYEGEEFVSDVGTGVLAKRRVVPEDVVALSVFPFAVFGGFLVQPKQANGKTDNATTSSGTTLLLLPR